MENKEVYKNSKEIIEVLHKNFQKMFTTESDFKRPHGQKGKQLDVGNQNREEIREMMK